MLQTPQLSREGQAQLQRELSDLLGERPEIQFACLHGSFLGTLGFRDLDIGVWVDAQRVAREQALDYELDLSLWLERRLSHSLPVDARVLNYAPLGFRYAASHGIPIVLRRPEAWYTFCEETWRDYWDFQPLADDMLRDLLSPARQRSRDSG
jgi:predicted nucleotidyltransferase